MNNTAQLTLFLHSQNNSKKTKNKPQNINPQKFLISRFKSKSMYSFD